MIDPHVTIEPSILYFGTPVVLISTENEDGTANLAPMSSAWWLGWRAMLGLQTASQTPQNMIRTGQCVLNPDLARPGGRREQAGAPDRHQGDPCTEATARLCIRTEQIRSGRSDSNRVPNRRRATRAAMPYPAGSGGGGAARHHGRRPSVAGLISAFEVRITRVHVHPGLLMDGHENRIDPAKWQPLIMNFQKLYGVSSTEIVPSRLAEIEEKEYRMPDVDRARVEPIQQTC